MKQRFWLQKNQQIIEKCILSKISSALKNLPLEIFMVSIAPYSGPIALLYDKNIGHQYILPQGYQSSIIIINVKGEIKKLINYTIKDRIIFFKFTKYQQLLVIDASGDFWIIDPFSGYTTSGNYGGINSVVSEKGETIERFRGCQLLPKQKLLLLRGKQLGITHSLHSGWQPINLIKPSFENPQFSPVGQQYPNQIIYLSKHSTIQLYNFKAQKKQTIYFDQYLSEHSNSLLGFSYNKKKSLLGLVYKQPSKILIINLQDKSHKLFEPLVDLCTAQSSVFKQETSKNLTNKNKSRSIYKSKNTQVGWLTCSFQKNQQLMIPQTNSHEQPKDFLVFCNTNLLLFSNGQSFHLQMQRNMIMSIEIDSLRLISETGHIIYRIVPYLYRLLVNPDQINQAYYHRQLFKYIYLRDQYSNYLDDKIVSLEKLTQIVNKSSPSYNLFKSSNLQKYNIQEIKQKLQQEQQKIQQKMQQKMQELQQEQQKQQKQQKNPDKLSNYITAQRQQIQKIDEIILMPLIEAASYCIDPVDQVKIFKFICFLKNYYQSKIDISEICQQFRIINALKFQYMNRVLTIQQFRALKYDEKQRFMTILLRYNMHYVANLIFKSSSDWSRIFLHWAKCKIQKNNQTLAYEEIKDKYQIMGPKVKDTRVFTEIAKYCMDRNKISLAENFVEMQEDHDRKIMVYLMLLAAKKDRKMIDRLLHSAQQTNRSFLIYRVIKELIDAHWVQNHIWTNLLYGKPQIERHYLRYLKAHNKQQLLKSYFLQNKQYNKIGFQQLKKSIHLICNKNDNQMHRSYRYNQQQKQQLLKTNQQYKKLLPNLYSTMKSYKNNQLLEILRAVKQQKIEITQSKLAEIKKNDIFLEYLSQILQKQGKEQMALNCIYEIKDDKAYGILLRKGKTDQAINLAYNRKNKEQLLEIRQRFPDKQQKIDTLIELLSKK